MALCAFVEKPLRKLWRPAWGARGMATCEVYCVYIHHVSYQRGKAWEGAIAGGDMDSKDMIVGFYLW